MPFETALQVNVTLFNADEDAMPVGILQEIVGTKVVKYCAEVKPDTLVPEASQIVITCHLYVVPILKPVNVKLFVVVVSKAHALDPTLYRTLYPHALATASHPKAAELVSTDEVFGFCGTVQGVKVVKISEEVHADTELLSPEHAERTCHS